MKQAETFSSRDRKNAEALSVPLAAQVLGYVKEQYRVTPDFLWKNSPNNAALRHHHSKKWFAALLLSLPKRALGLSGDGSLAVINVKCDPRMIGSLVDGKRFFPGYHMNKEHWLSIALDGSIPLSEICSLIDLSFIATSSKSQRRSV